MTFTKDPDATLDYVLDWTEWLGAFGDTIATSSWTVPDGLVKVTESNTSVLATVWLSGGTDGQAYSVTNRITTVGGRADDRTIKIKVRNK